MNDLERQQKLDKLKKRMLEMSATIAELDIVGADTGGERFAVR